MARTKIAVIDDDPSSVAELKSILLDRIPSIEVVAVAEPAAPIGFDIFLLEAKILELKGGKDLLQRVRSVAPNSLRLAYSSNLTTDLLRRLINEGCEGAFVKEKEEDIEQMLSRIENFRSSHRFRRPAAGGVGSTVSAITALIREWNTRLERNGRAYHRTYSD